MSPLREPGGPRRPRHINKGYGNQAVEHGGWQRALRDERHKPPGLKTVIGLLAVTGMRIGEVVQLDLTDIDWRDGLLTVSSGKFEKARQVPLHASTVAAMCA